MLFELFLLCLDVGFRLLDLALTVFTVHLTPLDLYHFRLVISLELLGILQ